jgi:cyclase
MKSTTLVLLLAFSSFARAQAPIQGKVYKFEKIADGIYYATGGSNTPVVVNDDDVLIVDDGTTPFVARALIEDLKLITNKPIKYVVNTHFHYDHTDGNQVFGPDVQIIAHEFVRHAILDFDVLHTEPFKTSQGRVPAQVEALPKQIADEKDPAKKATLERQLETAKINLDRLKEIKPTPPNVTYSSKLVIYKGGREIDLLFLGRGHTAGDTFVYLPKEGVICTGDMMETGPAYMGSAYFDEWIAALDKLKQMDFKVILPGHGSPFGDKAHITAFQNYIKDQLAQVTKFRQQGLSPEDAATKVDLTSHAKDFPTIRGPGVEVRGVRRMYEWLGEREKK